MANPKKGGLGRGLGALIGPQTLSATADESNGFVTGGSDGHQVLQLDPHAIRPNPMQPRVAFDEDALEELAESIRRDGVLEPIIVRRRDSGYELVSGERRVRAGIMAGLVTIPAISRDVSDADMLKLGLIENIQREDLSAIELARAYENLIKEFTWTQEELASQVGKKRATVTNTLRLLNLPPDVQRCVADGTITMGHARALLALPTANAQSTACRKILDRGLSVRQTEKMAQPPTLDAKKKGTVKDPNVAAIEENLRQRLGARVALRHGARHRGKIEIEYFNLDDLERILEILGVQR